jgi:hydrogenase 3 maturation protease
LKTDLHSVLLQRLKKVKNLAILGVGSELMQDDAAGIVITQNLIKKYGEDNPNFKIYSTYTNPENYTKIISDYNPDHIIIIDAANLNKQPGSSTYIPLESINDLTLGTHKISLIMMIKYLKEVISCEFTVIAIQYKSVEFACKMTKEMKEGVKQIIISLTGIIDNYYNNRNDKYSPGR